MDNIYSAYHYACKTKADREAVEKLVPEIKETAEKAVFGNIGDIKYTTRTTVPNGGYWCDGQIIAKSELEKVYQMLVSGELQCVDINTYNNVVSLNGSCGFFGLDVANESFRVPLLDEVYIKSGQVADEFGAESLPNIKGGFVFSDNIAKNDNSAQYAYSITGAFKGASVTANTTKASNATIISTASDNRQILFYASRSSSTYKDGAKVNPDHVKYRAYVILYFAEKEMSIVDWTKQLEKKTNEGIAQIDAKADSYLDKTQITNCITEIPQDIKLELKDGTLTLKAGSKVYVPNDFEADGTTTKFDEVIVPSDVVFNFGTSSGDFFPIYNPNNNTQSGWYVAKDIYSGNVAPTLPSGVKYAVWYDTTSNIIKETSDNGATWGGKYAFPLVAVNLSNGSATSINQVFNGFGYIGSTVFALPGVKGLIPNGRNEDGSLRNIEVIVDKVIITTQTNSSEWINKEVLLTSDKTMMVTTKNYTVANDGYLYNPQGTRFSACVIGSYSSANTVISNLNPKLPFRAVDCNDMYKKEDIVSWGMPSSQYIDLGTVTSYTAPADGIISWLTGSLGDWNQAEATVGNRKYYFYTFGNTGKGGWFEINKGEKVTFNTSSTSYKRFVYKKGAI